MDEETKKTIKAYNTHADEYYKRWHGHISRIEPTLLKFLSFVRGNKLLDVGCGTGRDCNYYHSKGYDVTGVDLSEKMIELCKKNYPGISFFNMNMKSLSFEDNLFDGLHCWSVIQHIKKENVKDVILEFNRVLKSEGILFISTREGSFEGYDNTMYDSPRWFTYYEKPFFSNVLEESGFKILSIEDAFKEEKGHKIKVNHFICSKI